ncbi:Bet v1-like protein [Meredithblackwellia eburnea MCA 4105]
MSAIPTATYVQESSVINAPLAKVWTQIKLGDFSNWWSKLSKSVVAKGTSEETDVFIWTFKDGTELTVKQEEHSSIEHSITYSVVAAQPALSYTSVVSTIRLYPITTGPSEGSTFITWSGSFSSDADAGVIEDARFKRKEALADLASKA